MSDEPGRAVSALYKVADQMMRVLDMASGSTSGPEATAGCAHILFAQLVVRHPEFAVQVAREIVGMGPEGAGTPEMLDYWAGRVVERAAGLDRVLPDEA